jgi:predicted transcriptional regulator
MTTLTITIPDEVAARLADLAKEDGKDPGALAGDALRLYLAERAEEAADLAAAREALAEGGEPIPWEQVEAEWDKEDSK